MKTFRFVAITIVFYAAFFFAVSQGFGVTEVVQANQNNTKVAGASTINNESTGIEIVDLINEARKQEGELPLAIDSDLNKIADTRTYDMVLNQYYSHITPNGTDFSSLFKEKRLFSCENLDLASTDSHKKAFKDWMNSDKGHRECLLDSRVSFIGFRVEKFDTTDNGERFVSVAILSSQK